MKLCCALGRYPNDREKLVEYLTTPVFNDITLREPHDGYVIMQGGTPEMEAFWHRFLK